MNKCQIALALFIGIQIGIRLPSAKVAAEQFKNSVGSAIVAEAAKIVSKQINNKFFDNYSDEN